MSAPSPVTAQRASPEISARFTSVGSHLGDSFRNLLAAVPNPPHRPMDLARSLGVKKDLSSRVLIATGKRDPIALMHSMPGPEALRRFIAAARKKSLPEPLLTAADAAVQDFDHLIRTVAGDRDSLDSIISAWLPHAREKVELLCKQSAFRGMRGVKGCATDLSLNTVLYHPSADGQHLDAVWIKGLFGLRRTRPGSVIQIGSRQIGPDAGATSLSLDGRSIETPADVLLPTFTSATPGELRMRREGATIHYLLEEGAVGNGAAVDVLLAERQHSCLDRYNRPGNPRKRGGFAEVHVPARELIFDTLVHVAAYPDSDPTLLLYDTTFSGVADVNDPARFVDRLDTTESYVSLGQGIAGLRVAEVPAYLDLLRHVAARMKWSVDEFRVYRCRISYPVYGTQVAMVFDAPA